MAWTTGGSWCAGAGDGDEIATPPKVSDFNLDDDSAFVALISIWARYGISILFQDPVLDYLIIRWSSGLVTEAASTVPTYYNTYQMWFFGGDGDCCEESAGWEGFLI